MDIDLPEVQSFAQVPRFFNKNGVEYIEIGFIGNKDTVVHKVTPEHMTRFRAAWDAYCDGKPMAKRAGTPLTDIAEINPELAEAFIRSNVHNLEEVCVLTDHHCQALGHGVLTIRKKAIQYIAVKQSQDKQSAKDMVAKMSATVRSNDEAVSEIAELKGALAEQAKKIDTLTEALLKMAEATAQPAPRPRGRPKKVQNNGSIDAVADRNAGV
jgi:hypothetical protein